MRKWLISLVLAVLVITFGGLTRVWDGFVYFLLVSLALLSGYWIVELILSYIYEYKKNIDERYKFYVAKVVNSTNYTSEDIEKGEAIFKKRFQKSLLREKAIEWLKIAFCVGVLIVSITLMFTI